MLALYSFGNHRFENIRFAHKSCDGKCYGGQNEHHLLPENVLEAIKMRQHPQNLQSLFSDIARPQYAHRSLYNVYGIPFGAECLPTRNGLVDGTCILDYALFRKHVDAPIIAALRQHGGNKICSVLVLGGAQSRELILLEQAVGPILKKWKVDVVTETTAHAPSFDIDDLTIYSHTLEKMIEEPYLYDSSDNPFEYDFIIGNMGMHRYCCNPVLGQLVAQIVDIHLKRDGHAFFTSIDFDTSFVIDRTNVVCGENIVQVLDFIPPSVAASQGIAVSFINGVYYLVPACSAGTIHDFFEKSDLRCSTVSFNHLFRDSGVSAGEVPQFKVPYAHIKKINYASPDFRPFIFIQITRPGRPVVDVLYPTVYDYALLKWQKCDGIILPPRVCNKSRVLMSQDLSYLNPQMLFVGEGCRGRGCLIHLYPGFLYLVGNDRAYYHRCPDYTGVKVVMSGEIWSVNGKVQSVRVHDVVYIEGGASMSFVRRWSTMKLIYDHYAEYFINLFTLVNFTRVHIATVMELRNQAREGSGLLFHVAIALQNAIDGKGTMYFMSHDSLRRDCDRMGDNRDAVENMCIWREGGVGVATSISNVLGETGRRPATITEFIVRCDKKTYDPIFLEMYEFLALRKPLGELEWIDYHCSHAQKYDIMLLLRYGMPRTQVDLVRMLALMRSSSVRIIVRFFQARLHGEDVHRFM